MEPSQRLANSPTLRLIRDAVRLARLVDRLIDQPIRRDMDLGSNDMYVLRSVLLGIDRPHAIARRVNMAPPSVSRSIERLVARGLLERTAAADDGRAVVLRLTASGHRTIENALDLAEAGFEEAYPALDPALLAATGAHMSALLEAMEGAVTTDER
jgi:DNA-binding MarR family transcriptional regulator